LCPFHRERKPSCKIDLERKIFHCFGCEAKGNVLEFVARMEGDAEDLRAAAIKIAEICGIATAAPRERAGASPAREHRRKGAKPQKPKRAAPRRDAAQMAHVEVHGGLTDAGFHGAAEAPNPPLTFALKLDPAHPYLAERRLSAEVVALFGLGYCSRGSMAGRVCIPIHNERGQLIAYAGRWPGDEDIPEGEDRYKLPAKFEKSRVLFNLHRVSDAEHVVLVEGYWSAIRLHALGVPVAALMGWSVSPEQIALLRDRSVRFVTLLLDGDDTGRRARERVLPSLSSSFFVRSTELEDGQKPDAAERARHETPPLSSLEPASTGNFQRFRIKTSS
jgi:DNA primase